MWAPAPFLEPRLYRGVARRIRRQPPAAAMRNGQARLQKHQALIGFDERHAPPFGTLHDLIEIEDGIKTKQTEPKAALAVMAAMTSPLVATGFREYRNDIPAKSDGRFILGAASFDRNFDALSASRNDHRAAAISGDPQLSRRIGRGQRRTGELVFRFAP